MAELKLGGSLRDSEKVLRRPWKGLHRKIGPFQKGPVVPVTYIIIIGRVLRCNFFKTKQKSFSFGYRNKTNKILSFSTKTKQMTFSFLVGGTKQIKTNNFFPFITETKQMALVFHKLY